MLPELIAKEQKDDTEIKKLRETGTHPIREWTIEGVPLLTIDNQIIISKVLQQRTVSWYHLYLKHPGQNRMENTLKSIYWWNNMRKDIALYVKTCRNCQLCKKSRKKYGHLPLKDMEASVPWNHVNINLIGPLSVKTKSKRTFVLNALTMIDLATGWFEISEIKERTVEHVAKVFDNVWLSRYPRPQYIGFENGRENKGLFKKMIVNYGQKSKLTTSHNPQSNGIIERVHAVLNDMLCTHHFSETEMDTEDPWTDILSSTAFAIWLTCHGTLEATPGQLVFNRDMVIPVKFTANWAYISQKRLRQTQKDNQQENARCIPHHYHVGDKVLYKKHGVLKKLDTPRRGPFLITKVYTNGTVQLKHGVVSERVNIRHLTPFVE
jgi:Integrase zinc binding domain